MLFSKKKKETKWLTLDSSEQLNQILKDSEEDVQVIFKHSTRCSISSMALNRFESKFDFGLTPSYYLDLISFRSVSNEIADRLDVQHESPQLIIVKKGEAVANWSHTAIDPDLVTNTIAEHK